MDKEEAKEKIKSLVEEFREIPKSNLDSMPEEDIKRIFITPLLEYLGWKKFDILSEARVLKGRADYILKSGNQELLVVEAKKTNVSLLGEKEGWQAVSYAYHRKIKFAVLTNFKELKVYHALSNVKDADKNLLKKDGAYFRLSFDEFLDKFDLLWLISKESFEKGEINKLLSAKDEKINKSIDEKILEDLLEIRSILSKELKSKKPYLAKEIDEIVQIFIDRLIFIRSVEDRGIEPANFLLGLDSDVRNQRVKYQLFPYLLEKFNEFNKKYDSKLFENGILEKEGAFSDDTLHRVIRILYYGKKEEQSKYNFDEIPGDIFGNIYEQYLGTILSSTEKRVKLDKESGKRKKMGIYYTPSYIVDYIVKNTVGEYIKDKGIDEILKVKILDPACGSGSFLIRAFQEVCDKIEELMKEGKPSNSPTFKKYENGLNLAQKVTILTHCIYGVDLDEKAVELSRLNLLLKTLEGEGQSTKRFLLPHLSNIKNGNSLIDDPKVSDHSFNWHAQFPDVFNQGGFDVVIGNPPYFSMQTAGKKIQKYFETSEKWKKIYRGQSDILYYFIIHGLRILKEKGQFGFITSRYWLENKWADKLREFIINNSKIEKLIDFRENYIFGDAGVHTSILILNKEDNENLREKNQINFFNFLEENKKIVDLSHIKFSVIPQNTFSNKLWVFVSRDSNNLLDKTKINTQPLERLAFIGKGYDTGLNEVFEITQEVIKKDNLEKELLVKDVKNGDIKRYFIDWRGLYMIYLTKKEDIEKYPNTLKYLSKFKNKLMDRYAYKNKQCKWFSLSTLRNKDLFDNSKEKIVVPYLAPRNNFALDEVGYYNGGAEVFIIVIREKKNMDIKYLLGILNSKLLTYYVHEVGKKKGGVFRYSTTYLKDLPIHLPTPSQEQKLVSLVTQMLSLQQKCHDEKVSGNEKERLEQQIKNVDYEIDEEVYNLYGITSEEKKIIEESLK